MALRKLLNRLTTSVEELDRQKLEEFVRSIPDVTPIADLEPRQECTIVGEIQTLRIVPRAGSPSLEAMINDGTGTIVAMWTGRRRIAGVGPGRKLIVTGRAAETSPGGRLLLFNPRYELL